MLILITWMQCKYAIFVVAIDGIDKCQHEQFEPRILDDRNCWWYKMQFFSLLNESGTICVCFRFNAVVLALRWPSSVPFRYDQIVYTIWNRELVFLFHSFIYLTFVFELIWCNTQTITLFRLQLHNIIYFLDLFLSCYLIMLLIFCFLFLCFVITWIIINLLN